MIFSSPTNSDSCQERQIVDEAMDWLMSAEDRECTALRDGAAQPEGFLHWLNRSPEHIRVFLEISFAHYSLCGIDAQCGAESGAPANSGSGTRSNVVNLRPPRPLEVDESWLHVVGSVTSRRQPVSHRSRWVVASVLGAIAIGAGTWLSAGSSEPRPLDRSSLMTQVGERSITQFEDGSAVYLNTATNMELQSEGQMLSGRLGSGEVFLQIPPNSRALHLAVGDLRLNAVAGQLDVRYEMDDIQISVLEGRVRLSCDCAPQEVDLPAGFQLRMDAGGGLSRIQPQPLTRYERDTLTGWRDGRLYFAGQPLSEVVREVNRYNRRQLRIGDPAIAGLPIGGIFLATDVDSFIAFLGQMPGLQIQADGAGAKDTSSVLLSRAAARSPESTTP
jgi:ferric-dicitrate binding protein FerR (iron transport regulator)